MQSVRKGAVLIIRNKDDRKYLLLKQKKDNTWSLISGGREIGEDFADTAIREAREEAGLNLQKPMLKDTNVSIRFVSSKVSSTPFIKTLFCN